jgi:hypothetical protein
VQHPHSVQPRRGLLVTELDLVAALDNVERRVSQDSLPTLRKGPGRRTPELGLTLAPIAPGMEVSPLAVEHPTEQPTPDEWGGRQA